MSPEERKAHSRKASKRFRETHPDYRKNVRYIQNQMLRSARSRARTKGISFDIVRDDIPIPDVCPVLGIPLVIGASWEQRDSAPSIDRLDNTKGYEKWNVLVVSCRANSLKRDATIEELRKLADFYEALAKSQQTG